MLDKLDLKSKRVVALAAIIVWGGVEAYLKHEGIAIPSFVEPVLAALGLTAHYALPKA